ncbi:hypothetical protein ABG768_020809 [Culter alburnus]|uniref:C-type lectin domain-containing protein n=1 Tax=Culter alburnus TaxID=194366 RepID=A0AAW2AR31_CULAL
MTSFRNSNKLQQYKVIFIKILLTFPPSAAASRLRQFYIGSDRMNRTPAEEKCRRDYTDLVTVYDHQDNEELAKLLNGTHPSGWIGASIGRESTKKWSNGDDVIFDNSLTGSCGETCCATMNADGKWESHKCTYGKYFMCYKQESYNYSLIREDKTWFEAQLYCRENYTDLASIRNDEENTEVMKKREQHNNPFWIGLLVDSVEWADGGQSVYRSWEPRHLDSLNPEVYINQQGQWQKAGKLGDYYPLCYKSFIHVSTDEKTWEEALDYCNSHKNTTGLLTIQSQSDQTEIERELKKTVHNISGPMWVGLRQSRLFGFWIWINGVTVGPWTNWKGGSQPEHLLSHHCGAIEEVNGQYKWTDKDCRSKLGVLCEGK